MAKGLLCFFYSLFFFSPMIFAEQKPQKNECWVGDSEQTWLIKILSGQDKEASKDSVIQEWIKYRQRQKSTEGQFCAECEFQSHQKSFTGLEKIKIPQVENPSSSSQESSGFFNKLAQLAKRILPSEKSDPNLSSHPLQERVPEVPSTINPICIAASLQRDGGSNQWKCKTRTSSPKLIEETPCLRKEEVRYIAWLTNSAIQCLNSMGQNIKPEIVFSLINNESGFRFFVGSEGGKGILQLTTKGKEEVLPPKKKKGLKESPILGAIQNASNPSCMPFKKSLSKFNAEETRMNTCQLLSPGEGFANSLMLSLILYLTYRGPAAEKNIPENLLPEKSETLSKDLSYSSSAYLKKSPRTHNLSPETLAELSQFLAMHAFSRHGPFSVKDLLQDLKFQAPAKKENLHRYIELFTQSLVEKSEYTSEVQSKLDEVKKFLEPATNVFERNKRIEEQNLGPLRASQPSKKSKAPLIDSDLMSECFANAPSPSR